MAARLSWKATGKQRFETLPEWLCRNLTILLCVILGRLSTKIWRPLWAWLGSFASISFRFNRNQSFLNWFRISIWIWFFVPPLTDSKVNKCYLLKSGQTGQWDARYRLEQSNVALFALLHNAGIVKSRFIVLFCVFKRVQIFTFLYKTQNLLHYQNRWIRIRIQFQRFWAESRAQRVFQFFGRKTK